MRNTFQLGTTVPVDEPCAQVGTKNYEKNAKIEAEVFKAQLLRIVGPPPNEDTYLKVTYHPHDFGTYSDMTVYYDDEDEESEAWMLMVEGNLPAEWDEIAQKELKERGYQLPSKYDFDEEE